MVMVGQNVKRIENPRGRGTGDLVCVLGRALGTGNPIHFFLPGPQL